MKGGWVKGEGWVWVSGFKGEGWVWVSGFRGEGWVGKG